MGANGKRGQSAVFRKNWGSEVSTRVAILRAIARHGGEARLAEVAHDLALDRTTVRNQVRTFEQMGIVRLSQDNCRALQVRIVPTPLAPLRGEPEEVFTVVWQAWMERDMGKPVNHREVTQRLGVDDGKRVCSVLHQLEHMGYIELRRQGPFTVIAAPSAYAIANRLRLDCEEDLPEEPEAAVVVAAEEAVERVSAPRPQLLPGQQSLGAWFPSIGPAAAAGERADEEDDLARGLRDVRAPTLDAFDGEASA